MTRLATCAIMLAAIMLSACGARKEVSIGQVEVQRPTWDSLVVTVSFIEKTSLGRPRALRPDSAKVVAYGTTVDTLFAGPGPGFDFPDDRLGDREGVVLDVCGAVRGRWICEQTGVRASPKVLRVDADVDYPIDDDFSRGRFAVATRVEREAIDGDGAERVGSSRAPKLALEAYVDGAEHARVRVPLGPNSGTFDLTRQRDYADFRFYLDSSLMDEGEATVHFVVFGGFDAPTEQLVHLTKTVSPVSREDRVANVEGFVRQTARILVDDLSSFLGGRRMAAYLHGWHFDASTGRYEIDMEVRWRGSFFDQRDYVLEGVLVAGETGADAVFELREGNRAALERWDRRMRSSERRLGTLTMERPIERYRPGARRQDPPL